MSALFVFHFPFVLMLPNGPKHLHIYALVGQATSHSVKGFLFGCNDTHFVEFYEIQWTPERHVRSRQTKFTILWRSLLLFTIAVTVCFDCISVFFLLREQEIRLFRFGSVRKCSLCKIAFCFVINKVEMCILNVNRVSDSSFVVISCTSAKLFGIYGISM